MKINRVRSLSSIAIVTFLLTFCNDLSVEAKPNNNSVYNKNNIIYINKYNNISNIDNILINKINSGNKSKNFFMVLPTSRYLIRAALPSEKIKLSDNNYDKEVIMSRIASGIRSTETGGKGAYKRKSYSSDACGAYQYMPSTWNNYMGYKGACQAPAWVQDKKMISELKYGYKKYKGNWKKVIAAHFMPARANNPSSWHLKNPGNPTVNQYVKSVMRKARLTE